ncbi:PLAT domain-containing protein [Caenorhabditis elegans]|uniref:PLAT domain-containing protein n=1 Tax=Caenorhabditis elegans TaxID=6239 RepID=Q9N4M8_CAEEL|nr:PLAT domain-containing protein [Caenorhabditis elegans]CCD71114.3 PLAT domain-containing protein [Caenorhabditis elegans]|eukprot:NP_500807.3 Uncharacterized protein CELE_ZK616.8 [Caenorhabditis elegans]
MAAESIKEMGSSVRSKYDDDDCPAAFTILIRTSSDSTPDGPSEKISILIRDDEGRATDKQALRYSHTHPTPFQRGHSDLFVMANQPSLGPLTCCEIHYDGAKEALGTPWKFHTINIFHHENRRVYNFQRDEQQSTETVSALVCKDDGAQVMPAALRDPFA